MTPGARPELVFALVGPIGSDLDAIEGLLRECLGEFGYQSETIRLSSLLNNLNVWGDQGQPTSQLPEDERVTVYMDAARAARERSGRDDILVLNAILEFITARRKKRPRAGQQVSPVHCPKCSHEFNIEVGAPPLRETAFILHSLKHPEEVRTLQRLYGPGFFLIGVSSSEDNRRNVIVDRIRSSREKLGVPRSEEKLLQVANELMARDLVEEGVPSGQRVRDTFHLADIFVGVGAEGEFDRTRAELLRFLDLLFSDPFPTPRRDEYAMFLAHVAATRSGSLARQVGAVLATKSGEVIALGANEMARPGGGLIWDDDPGTLRDSDRERGRDTGVLMKERAAQEVWEQVQKLVSESAKGELSEEVLKQVLEVMDRIPETDVVQMIQKAPTLGSMVEFYREVHAEMAALVDAARRGVETSGTTAFVTTYPCHDCAKHLVSAGVRRIVYIEPYPKSHATEFYPNVFEKTQNEKLPDSQRVAVEPFVGIGPRCFWKLFTLTTSEGVAIRRRRADGWKTNWNRPGASLRWRTWSESYLDYELMLAEEYRRTLDEACLRRVPSSSS